MNTGEEMSNGEQYARKHYGLLEIIQTAIGGLILLVASIVYWTIRDYAFSVQQQAKDIAVIQSQMSSLNSMVTQNQTRVDAQIAAMTTISSTLIQMDTKMTEDEKEIEEIRKARLVR